MSSAATDHLAKITVDAVAANFGTQFSNTGSAIVAQFRVDIKDAVDTLQQSITSLTGNQIFNNLITSLVAELRNSFQNTTQDTAFLTELTKHLSGGIVAGLKLNESLIHVVDFQALANALVTGLERTVASIRISPTVNLPRVTTPDWRLDQLQAIGQNISLANVVDAQAVANLLLPGLQTAVGRLRVPMPQVNMPAPQLPALDTEQIQAIGRNINIPQPSIDRLAERLRRYQSMVGRSLFSISLSSN